ncbi:PREDICTED: flowering-promoting factor 1-like [Nelumbo nucifera]|uniref:Flowering-promoting factor 1-like protein 1 n=2 Tax=Nelumbo nucifera TaxID=4432 RepID=A0A822YYU8_NELNU|nr:PREDICTED: flowering-promoting factor 1-like [Nelumbo nucifera]DAD37852.1 TPA_asm: hypothetical protein HUJ06_008493 [Nelumbo nucifera]
MSGVLIFRKNGVVQFISNPTKESFQQEAEAESTYFGVGGGTATAPGARPRVLVYVPSNQVIKSYAELEQRLQELGWTRYHNGQSRSSDLIQYHRSDASAHLISLPTNFNNFSSIHMYDIVVKNPSYFHVRLL